MFIKRIKRKPLKERFSLFLRQILPKKRYGLEKKQKLIVLFIINNIFYLGIMSKCVKI